MEKRLENMKKEYDNIPVPSDALNRVKMGINQAKEEKKITSFTPLRRIGLGLAAAVALCIISVNSSAQVAQAMGELPVVGGFFKVITFREYGFESDTNSAQASVPEIVEDSEAAGEVNAEVKEYIDEIMLSFKEDCEAEDLGYESLDINYSVITDNEKHFSLDIIGANTAAGGYEFHKYYTIDKKSDRVLRLSDLYPEGYDYVSEISSEIIRQMEEDKDGNYVIGEEEEGFTEISPDQNFYINEKGNLVICFNEYEVGPGSIGAPRFEIER